MSNAKRLVIVDDDAFIMEHYVELLRLDGYEVILFDSLSMFWSKYQVPLSVQEVDMFVIDVMMPTDHLFPAKQTSGGLLTGLFLAREVRQVHKTTPIILFSATSFLSVASQAKRLTKQLSYCAFLEKLYYPPNKLSDFITQYFAKGKFTTNLLRRLARSAMLEPNLSGIGIDLKKLVGRD